METYPRQWMYGGVGILIVSSSSILIGGAPNIWAPLPLPIYFVIFIVIVLFPFVTSMAYWAVLKFVSPSRHFSKVILISVLCLAFLDAWYFYSQWQHGVEWQGIEHTKIVALENAVGFGLVLVLSFLALIRESRSLALTANLLLFVLLSWCAFPYLGEIT